MAQLVINIPDALEIRVVAGFAIKHGYPTMIYQGSPPVLVPNPQTPKQFLKEQVKAFILRSVREAEAAAAAATAATAAETSVDTDIVLT